MKIQDRQFREKLFAHLDLHSTFFHMQLFVSILQERKHFLFLKISFFLSSVVAREWGNLDGIELICWSPPGVNITGKLIIAFSYVLVKSLLVTNIMSATLEVILKSFAKICSIQCEHTMSMILVDPYHLWREIGNWPCCWLIFTGTTWQSSKFKVI